MARGNLRSGRWRAECSDGRTCVQPRYPSGHGM